MKIQLIDYGGKEPCRAHENDAGADVFSTKDLLLQPGETYKVPLGFGIRIPNGLAGYIYPRSSLSTKGLVCQLPPIDAGYEGQIHAIVTNVSKMNYEIKVGDKIGQLVVLPVVIPNFTYEIGKERGTDAFGSTGR